MKNMFTRSIVPIERKNVNNMMKIEKSFKTIGKKIMKKMNTSKECLLFAESVTIIYYEDRVYINDIGKRAYVKAH